MNTERILSETEKETMIEEMIKLISLHQCTIKNCLDIFNEIIVILENNAIL
ncbi:hypothetical protein [Thomasclavelia ramosa]|uniref:hypothetical protein n=1 Tax=Thomasclavelia ramosa TaxID=1547 RepID=UPI0022DF4198|nr:hypothetical protein [Thomasclavelia ramosa]